MLLLTLASHRFAEELGRSGPIPVMVVGEPSTATYKHLLVQDSSEV